MNDNNFSNSVNYKLTTRLYTCTKQRSTSYFTLKDTRGEFSANFKVQTLSLNTIK